MPDYLAVPEHRRDRAVHEKARMARRGEIHWIRLYADDLADDLFGEPPLVRFLDIALLAWAIRSGWVIPYDSRAIGGRYGFRGREVQPVLERLLELRRFELIHAADPGENAGEIQPALFASSTAGTSRQHSGTTPGPLRQHSSEPPAQPSPTEPGGLAPDPASQRLARARGAEKVREEVPSRATSKEDARAAAGLPADLLEQGWNPAQIRVATADPERAQAWLDYARREPGITNLGGYTWARFVIPDTWPNGKRPLTADEKIIRLERWAKIELIHYPRPDALEEIDLRVTAWPPALRPTVRDRLIHALDTQEPPLD